MDCIRYTFTYLSGPEEVTDYIIRSVDYAEKTYGRDPYFARFNQMLDQARFLGWKIPRFGSNIPEIFQDLAPEAIDHIFENQAKILVDISPVTQVTLENGEKVTVRLICATTPAGDLVWKPHFIQDSQCRPCIDHQKKFRAKTSGTKVLCDPEFLPYDEDILISYFDIDGKGVWPVPFLPECFSHHPLAQAFSVEDGVIEVVSIAEAVPLKVIATTSVPWYRSLSIDRTKALPMMSFPAVEEEPEKPITKRKKKIKEIEEPEEESGIDFDSYLEGLNQGLASSPENDSEELPDLIDATNVIVSLTPEEKNALENINKELQSLNLTKEKLKSLAESASPQDKQTLDTWNNLNTSKNDLLAGCESKTQALVSLVKKHQDSSILIIQPRETVAAKFAKALADNKLVGVIQNQDNIDNFLSGNLQTLIAHKISSDLFLEGSTIISAYAPKPLFWLENLDASNKLYTLAIDQENDHNYLKSNDLLQVKDELFEKKSKKKKKED